MAFVQRSDCMLDLLDNWVCLRDYLITGTFPLCQQILFEQGLELDVFQCHIISLLDFINQDIAPCPDLGLSPQKALLYLNLQVRQETMRLFKFQQFSLELSNIEINLAYSTLMQGVQVVNIICVRLFLFVENCFRLWLFKKLFRAYLRLVDQALVVFVYDWFDCEFGQVLFILTWCLDHLFQLNLKLFFFSTRLQIDLLGQWVASPWLILRHI